MGHRAREQGADQRRGGPQPVAFVVEARQDLGHGRAERFRVGHVLGVSGARPGACGLGGDEAVVQLDVRCGQGSVQVGVHGRPQGANVW